MKFDVTVAGSRHRAEIIAPEDPPTIRLVCERYSPMTTGVLGVLIWSPWEKVCEVCHGKD